MSIHKDETRELSSIMITTVALIEAVVDDREGHAGNRKKTCVNCSKHQKRALEWYERDSANWCRGDGQGGLYLGL